MSSPKTQHFVFHRREHGDLESFPTVRTQSKVYNCVLALILYKKNINHYNGNENNENKLYQWKLGDIQTLLRIQLYTCVFKVSAHLASLLAKLMSKTKYNIKT